MSRNPKVTVISPYGDKEWVFTAKQAKVLEVMTDPANYHLTMTEKAEMAGITRAGLYYSIGTRELTEAMKDHAMANVAYELPGLMNAAIQTAKVIGSAGHQDRKMLLSTMGIVTDKREQTNDVTLTMKAVFEDLDGRAKSIPSLDSREAPRLLEVESEENIME